MEASMTEFQTAVVKLGELRKNIQSVFYGKPDVVGQLLVGLLAPGHILIQDVPGVGKTLLGRALAKSISARFSRIQLTPDLLPSDIVGVSVYNSQDGEFAFKKGPIFANIILADEINRATPRTQSALLEAMNEAQVSVDGHSYQLQQPFLVIATQNPFEFEGTYFLPENQLDRFMMKIVVGYPPREAEILVLLERPWQTSLEQLSPVMDGDDVVTLQKAVDNVRIDESLVGYLMDLVEATRSNEHFEVGVSPRGAAALLRAAKAQALVESREFVIPDDIKGLAQSVWAHRVVSKNYMHNGQHGVTNEDVILDILDRIPSPS
jgi:MoxR-like ATPase